MKTGKETSSYSLPGGAESSGDDSLCVSLQRAGAACHRSDPEHSLRLVHNGQDLLCVHTESLHTQPQTGHHLCLATHKKCQWHRLLLQWRKKNNKNVFTGFKKYGM